MIEQVAWPNLGKRSKSKFQNFMSIGKHQSWLTHLWFFRALLIFNISVRLSIFSWKDLAFLNQFNWCDLPCLHVIGSCIAMQAVLCHSTSLLELAYRLEDDNSQRRWIAYWSSVNWRITTETKHWMLKLNAKSYPKIITVTCLLKSSPWSCQSSTPPSPPV